MLFGVGISLGVVRVGVWTFSGGLGFGHSAFRVQ